MGAQVEMLESEGLGPQSHPSTTFNNSVTLERLLILSGASVSPPVRWVCSKLSLWVAGRVSNIEQ